MASSLLTTRFCVPPPSHHVVPRARLLDLLERDIPHYKLILVSAPAGYGKTALLSQWARSSRFPVAWLSISAEDSDPERFFRYLLAAWEKIQPGISESSLGVLLGAMAPDIDAVLEAFVNVASEQPGQMIFVLDDYHLIDEPTVHQALTFLLDHLPSTLHFVLAGRTEPPLPLARYRARREMLEVRSDELRFSEDETTEFFKRIAGLELTDDEIVQLQAQLEGWIAGIQMAALTLRRRGDLTHIVGVGGRHRFIADYLKLEILDQQPSAVQSFLLQTSILDRLSGPLCDAVTGTGDGQATLELLERENLFLVPLDDNREWYRYHRLFADFLQEELNRRHPDQVAHLHRRAARWLLEHDLPEPAFHHAVAGDDLELAARIAEGHIFVKLHSGEFRVLKGWLDALPVEWYSAYPTFGLARAGLFAYTGAVDACVRCVDEVEQMLVPVEIEHSRWQLARVAAVRCFIACFQNEVSLAETYAERALRDLRKEDLAFRADIYHALGDTYRRNARWEEAKECYLKVLDFTEAPTFRAWSPHVFGALADLELRQGRLQLAADYWRKALVAIQDPGNWGRFPLPVIGWVYVRMAETLYEWNDLSQAWDFATRGLERAELGGDVRALIAGCLIAGRVKLAEGDVEEATGYLERARPLVEQASFPEWTGRFERLQLELWLTQDRLRAAVQWADAMLPDDNLQIRPESEATRLALARMLIFKGDVSAVGRALPLLDGLLDQAEREGRVGIQIEALALQALAHWQRGDRAAAMTALADALRLAEPEGYVRLFADLGLPIGRLLQEARSREVMPDYVAKLLSAYGNELNSLVPAYHGLPERLTDREQEILELMAAGLTNNEIADRLVISPETVKKHTGNIYGKLGVRTRTEAAARARDLHLLR